MKKILLGLLNLLFATGLFAQSNKEDIELMQAVFGKDKKELVKQYMELNKADSAKFWVLYDQYENGRKALGTERIHLLQEYARDYDKLNDQKATALTEKNFAINSKVNQLQQTYFKKFTATIGGLKAAKFFQLENYIENAIRLSIQNEIPFIGELEMHKKPAVPQPEKN
ncbi:hypothetical protein [Solitalea koreensis]|uniref:Periplasmic chaperone for outer membrane proteins Skp n=1 Tax=Solitalea koreensis TaxID=543615 RepID=A0A521C546_9SPHI|nr:hypothetical protein [Solitalea koreensis]SMO54465.1 hypothetical protein SAMN06265350_103215 [Solitalea koreensis]